MHSSATKHLLLVVVVTCSLLSVSVMTTTHAIDQPAHQSVNRPTCIPHERDALLAFKQGITSDPAGLLDSWKLGDQGEQDCCRWRGVQCSSLTGHVSELRLSGYSDGGKLLVGQISPSLLTLEYLEHLDLSFSRLEGSTGHIPKFLGSFKNLRYLDLSSIPFLGILPPELGNLSKLQYLDLSAFEFGYTNSTDISWLTRLSSLQQLALGFVDLSAVASWAHVVNMIPSLRAIDLSSCSLVSANQSLSRLNLTNLEELDLYGNQFNHPTTTCWFWNITTFEHLDLSYTRLHGQVPNTLRCMTSLQYLSLSGIPNNTLSMMMSNLNSLCSLRILQLEECFTQGHIVDLIEKLPECLSNKLQELYLSSNHLTGVLPNSMAHLTSLVVLDLRGNNITGPLPKSIGHFSSLRTLDLSDNHLTGNVPYEIGLLANMTKLDLGDNYLDGVVTGEHFAGTRSLQYLDLSGNSLKLELSSEWQPSFRLFVAGFADCQMGPVFPAWLEWQVNISFLDISSAGINDTIPHWFDKVFSNAVIVNISNNTLSGGLPASIVNMRLEILDLSSNQLTGPIPPLPISLEYLFLGFNKLTGPVPPLPMPLMSADFSANKLTGPVPPLPPSLFYLDISMNTLEGPLPDFGAPSDFGAPWLLGLFLFSNSITGHIPNSICKFERLGYLNLANNFLEGNIPPCLGMTDIISLGLSNNSLSGELPSSLQNCTDMIHLDLAMNNFSGSLPIWIGNLQALQFIRLSHNMFSGSIPISITNLGCLLYLDIAHNGMSGPLPRNLSNLTAMREKFWGGSSPSIPSSCYYDDGYREHQNIGLSAVTKGQELDYVSVYNIIDIKMVSIDLSSNNLTGEIPEDVATLDALVSLNISRNHITGSIPNQIGAMQSLESLDLSRNILCGDIPATLSNLTFLTVLDLSYNNLTGTIPSGSQLQTIYAAHPFMYKGNKGLCGPPLQKNRSSNNASSQGHLRRAEEDHVPEFFYLGVGCGFIVGIWVVFCALLFKKTWRIAYFQLFNKLYDKAYVLVFVTWARLTAT